MSYKLCHACAEEQVCNHNTAQQTIVNCDEFHGAGGAPARDTKPKTHKTARKHTILSGCGLCVNCDHRNDCTYADPSQFVMQCEEYA